MYIEYSINIVTINCRSVEAISTAQLHSTKLKLRFHPQPSKIVFC